MTDPANIKAALADLEPGEKVILRLADGTRLEGQLAAASDAEHVQLADADAVELDQVEDVLVQISSDGIE